MVLLRFGMSVILRFLLEGCFVLRLEFKCDGFAVVDFSWNILKIVDNSYSQKIGLKLIIRAVNLPLCKFPKSSNTINSQKSLNLKCIQSNKPA